MAAGPALAAGFARIEAETGFPSCASAAAGRATTVVAAVVAAVLAAVVVAEVGAAGLVVGTAVAGGRAITVFAGGTLAIAGADVAITLGAGRGCGTILRGSGLGGTTVTVGCLAAGGATVGAAAGGAAFAGGATGLRTAACSACCLLARIAFSASPGLEMPDRSIFGRIATSARAPADPDAAFPPFFR